MKKTVSSWDAIKWNDPSLIIEKHLRTCAYE